MDHAEGSWEVPCSSLPPPSDCPHPDPRELGVRAYPDENHLQLLLVAEVGAALQVRLTLTLESWSLDLEGI